MSLNFRTLVLGLVAVVAFGAGVLYSMSAEANDRGARRPRVVQPRKTTVDFEGLAITGELRNPGEFYFQRKTDEKFDSLVQRRKNFHREMLRDAVMAR